MNEHNDILSQNTENQTRPSSNINANDDDKVVTYEHVQKLLDEYFEDYTDPNTTAAYNKGEIFSLNDEFDFYKFYKGICTIFEDNVVQNKLPTQQKIQTRQLFNIINSCIDMLKTIDVKKDNTSIIITMIKHCTSAYDKYNKNHVRSREI